VSATRGKEWPGGGDGHDGAFGGVFALRDGDAVVYRLAVSVGMLLLAACVGIAGTVLFVVGSSDPPTLRGPDNNRCFSVEECPIELYNLPVAMPLTKGTPLSVKWTVTQGAKSNAKEFPKGKVCPAAPPSSIYDDLGSCGMLKEGHPYYRFNELGYRWVAHSEWTYTATFDWPASSDAIASVLHKKKNGYGSYSMDGMLLLEFEGLDTLATIYLNGAVLGTSDNMFNKYTFTVTGKLKERNNITIAFANPIVYGNDRQNDYPFKVPVTQFPNFLTASENPKAKWLPSPGGRNFVRKAQSDFGWDWGPALIGAGVWKPVHILALHAGRIDYVSPRQTFASDGSVTLQLVVGGQLRAACRTGPLAVEGILTPPGVKADKKHSMVTSEQVIGYDTSGAVCRGLEKLTGGYEQLFPTQTTLTFHLPKPTLWWPIGYSDTPGQLYRLEVRLRAGTASSMGYILDKQHKRVGIRKVRLIMDPLFDVSHGQSLDKWPACKPAIDWYRTMEPGMSFCDAYKKVRQEGSVWDNEKQQYCHDQGCCQSGDCNKCPPQLEQCTPSFKAETFYFEINGLPVWAKGANLIPFSSFHSSVTEKDMRRVLDAALEGNQNMLRVWGGGIYPVDFLYNWADENGVMLWQEFMFACGMYPTTKEFLGSVAEEVRQQAKRLTHHASVVVWGGNNENESAMTWFPEIAANYATYVTDYVDLYLGVILEELRKITGPSTVFVDSSPSNGPLTDEPKRYRKSWGDAWDPNRGDVHFYNYVMDCLDVTLYPRAKFISEFGFQSLPSLLTYFEGATDPSHGSRDFHIASHFAYYRQRHVGGNSEMIRLSGAHFIVPTSQQTLPRRLSDAATDTNGTSAPAPPVPRSPHTVNMTAWLADADPSHILREYRKYFNDSSVGLSVANATETEEEKELVTDFEPEAISRAINNAEVDDFDKFVYLTQLEQGRCYDAAVRHWRRIKADWDARTMGVLYWQLNDVWQGPSWSSLEYGGRWKLLHHMAQRFFAPLMVTVSFNTDADLLEVFAVSDIPLPVYRGTLTVQAIRYSDGTYIYKEVKSDIALGALTSMLLLRTKVSQVLQSTWWDPAHLFTTSCSVTECFLRFIITFPDQPAYVGGKKASEGPRGGTQLTAAGDAFFTPFLRASLASATVHVSAISNAEPMRWDPGYEAAQGGKLQTRAKIQLQANKGGGVALFVWLETAVKGHFSDNDFHLIPGEGREVYFICDDTIENLSARLGQTLHVRHLHEPSPKPVKLQSPPPHIS